MHKNDDNPNIENAISVLTEMLSRFNLEPAEKSSPTKMDKTPLQPKCELTAAEDQGMQNKKQPPISATTEVNNRGTLKDFVTLYSLAEKFGLKEVANDLVMPLVPPMVIDAQKIIRQINIDPINHQHVLSYMSIMGELSACAVMFHPDPTKKLDTSLQHIYIEIEETIKDLLQVGKLLPTSYISN